MCGLRSLQSRQAQAKRRRDWRAAARLRSRRKLKPNPVPKETMPTSIALTPLSAVSQRNPYPYYQNLLEGPGLCFDEKLQCWVASSAAVVDEIFTHPDCAVRPTAEPVPPALSGSSAAAVFAQLIRMNEGTRHAGPKLALQQALGSLNLGAIQERSAYFSNLLAHQHGLPDSAALTPWMQDLPIYVVGDLLGFKEQELAQLSLWMADFVRCLSPLSSADELAAASVAARALLQRFQALLEFGSLQNESLLSRVQAEAKLSGWGDQDALLANLIGLCSQTYEATAGLIGNAIVALLTQPQLLQQLRTDPQLVANMLEEVCRFDPPIQNTRRFVTQACTIAGTQLQAGDSILLLLAAASRDPQANPKPHEFIQQREARRLFGFGHGRHACPGQHIALTIATAAIQNLLQLAPELDAAGLRWTYRVSPNARIPLFTSNQESL